MPHVVSPGPSRSADGATARILSPRVRSAAAAASSKYSAGTAEANISSKSLSSSSSRAAAEIRSSIRTFLEDFRQESAADEQAAREAASRFSSGSGLRRSMSNPAAYPGYSVRTQAKSPKPRALAVDDASQAQHSPSQPTSVPRSVPLIAGSRTPSRGNADGLSSSTSKQINFTKIASNIRNGKLKLEAQEQLVRDLHAKVAEVRKDVERAKAAGAKKLEAHKKKAAADTQRLLDMIKTLSEDKKNLTEKMVGATSAMMCVAAIDLALLD